MAANLTAKLQKDADLGPGLQAVSLGGDMVLSNGSADDEANQLWSDERTLPAGGGSEELDLTADLVDIFGDVIVTASVKGLLLRNMSTDNSLIMGGAAVDAWTSLISGTLTLPPATAVNPSLAEIMAPAGLAVGAGNKVLRLENGNEAPGLSCTYKIGLLIAV
jgi:hypothetical protein